MKKILIILAITLTMTLPLKSQAQSSTALEAIGAISASDIYVKYIALGVLGDAYDGGTYKEQMVQQTATEIANLCEVTKEYFVKMKQDGTFSGDDVRFGIKMIETYDYLKAQADALHKYTRTGAVSDANDYQTYRKLAWENIKLLLNLQ